MALNLNNLPSFWRGTERELNTNKANVQNGAIYFLKPNENSKFGRIAFDYDNARIFVGSDDIHVKQTTPDESNSDKKYPLVISPVEGEGEVYRTPRAMITPNGNLYINSIGSIDDDPLSVQSDLFLTGGIQIYDGNIEISDNADIIFVDYHASEVSELSVKNVINTLTDNGTNIQSINTSIQKGIENALNAEDGVITEQIDNSITEGINAALAKDGAIAKHVSNTVIDGINAHNDAANAHENILAKKSVIYDNKTINCPIQSSIEITTENITGNTFTGNAFNFTKCLNYLFNNNIVRPVLMFRYINIKLVYTGTIWQGYLIDSANLQGSNITVGFYQDPSYYFSLNNLTDIGFSANEQVGTITTDSVIYLNLYARELCGIITFDDLPEVTLTSNQEVLPSLGATLKELTNLQTLQLQDGGHWENTVRLFAYGYHDEDIDKLPIRIIVRGD